MAKEMLHHYTLKQLLFEKVTAEEWFIEDKKEKAQRLENRNFKIALEEIADEGISAELLRKHYGRKTISNSELVLCLYHAPMVLRKCREAEASAKVMTGGITTIIAGIGALIGATSGGIAFAAISVLVAALSWFPFLRDYLDFEHIKHGKPRIISHYFGFDDKVIRVLPSGLDNSLVSSFSDEEIPGELRRVSSIRKKIESMPDNKQWTMASFQQFVIEHYFGEGSNTAESLKGYHPEHDFIDWHALHESLENGFTAAKLGFDRWAGDIDDSFIRKIRKGWHKYFGTESQIDLTDEEREEIRLEDELEKQTRDDYDPKDLI